MKVVLPSCKNLLLNSSFTILFLSILFQFPLSANNIAFSSTVDNSSEIKASQLDPDRNIITSQNTGISNSNTNDESQNRIQQEQTSDISLEDDQTNEEVSEIPEGNQEGVNQVSEGQQQPTVEIHPACGQIVQGKVKLISNLICKSDGLIVGANNTIIDMNGFSLKGPGLNSNKVGIMIGGQNNVTISGNGIISGFQSGIYLSGSNNVFAHEININNNKVAFYVTGAQDSEITNNMINNNTIGVALHSSDGADIKYNQLSQNRLSGVTLINTANTLINGNNILNTTNGIFIDTQSSLNYVDFNNVFNNILDINNANNLPININNNHYSNNNCMTSLPSGLCIGR
ncbi:MAG: right-handed parallel beta-helix repeat-containing protein [Thermoproteota archaeon]|nr:right-handed parallel beta-helix repeat-containing protein [Thermoproteota archaeon]